MNVMFSLRVRGARGKSTLAAHLAAMVHKARDRVCWLMPTRRAR